jgi:predicted ribosomally synthesized peptide with SipW-like signal peptide
MGRKTLISILMIAAALAMIGGGTFAAFSDTETSVGNTFTAGSLDLKVQNSGGAWVDDPSVESINAAYNELVSNLKPGDSGTITIPVKNAGSLPGTATFTIADVVDAGNATPEPEAAFDPDNGELSANIDVVVMYNGAAVAGGSGKLLDLEGDLLTAPAPLAAAGEAAWSIQLSIASGVGNVIMADTAVCSVDFGLNL